MAKKEEKKKEDPKAERMKRKHGGMVPGAKPAARLDKRARGGAAKSPLSGADAPNLNYAHGNLKAGSEGKGKDRT